MTREMKAEIVQEAIAEYQAVVGAVAWYHPRKHTVSLNGFPPRPEAEAVAEMRKAIARRRKGER